LDVSDHMPRLPLLSPALLASSSPEAETARWMVARSDWGYVTTLTDGAPSAAVLSLSDSACSDAACHSGRLFFYIATSVAASQPGATSLADADSGCNASLTLSQAALNRSTGCEAAALDPEDPRCTKLTLSGRLARTQGPATALGRAALFARHPQMRRWPASHGFEVFELRPADVWMIDFYGGGAHIPPEEYYAATPRHNVPPSAASTAATAATTTATAAAATAPPARDRSSASLARWLVYHSGWSSLGTVSVRLGGRPWSNVRSVADGLGANSTGKPVLYLPFPDPSYRDIEAEPRASLSFSQASLAGAAHGLAGGQASPPPPTCGGVDPEDPTCARLHLYGTLRPLTTKADVESAEARFCARHPHARWLCEGGAHTGGRYYAIEPTSLVFFDDYGGAAALSVAEYLAASPLGLPAPRPRVAAA